MPASGPPDQGSSVAVLGAGIMGSAMARNLLAAGCRVTAWDRSAPAAALLAEAGAVAAGSAPEAVRDSGLVITALPSGDAVNLVMFGPAMLEAFPPGCVWAQMGTIGVEATFDIARRLGQLRPDVRFVDAPVLGGRGAAERAELLILASGPAVAAARAGPVFSVLGRRTVWLGDAGQGSKVKLVVNAYLSVLAEGVTEALELAGRLGVSHAQLDEVIEGAPLGEPIAGPARTAMDRRHAAAAFPVEWAGRDVDLALGAGHGDPLPLLATLARQWQAAVDGGEGREDISAARLALGGHS
ncbi:MAG TPA: NAD(P)-dependent oxidoreductase [Streptosporangiaceae bacterium]|jgi:3-hydroxyisobutyrate dehydrogenase